MLRAAFPGVGVKGCSEATGLSPQGAAYPESAKNIFNYASCGRFCVAQSVRISVTNSPVEFAELLVFGLPDVSAGTVGQNLAAGKLVTVFPSIGRGGIPGQAGAALVDGDPTTSCSTPIPGVPGTITLNLGKPTIIHRISLYNRQDGVSTERDNGAVVALLDGANAVVKQWNPLTSKSGSTTYSDTGTNGWKKWYAKGGLRSALYGSD